MEIPIFLGPLHYPRRVEVEHALNPIFRACRNTLSGGVTFFFVRPIVRTLEVSPTTEVEDAGLRLLRPT